MKLQELVVVFAIIIVPITFLLSFYISTGTKTLTYQSLYDHGLLTATHDAIYAFELNTTNDAYSDNAETKRNILKSSVKQFEKSLVNACGIASYNVNEIEEYIPAIVFGMYDGFYLYAPSLNVQTGKYEHNLKNYVYYSEKLSDGTVIIYSLDNYVTVMKTVGTEYIIKSGYLLCTNKTQITANIRYKDINITENEAQKYYQNAYDFSKWFLDTAGLKSIDYLDVQNTDNDPENENSLFVQHKRKIMKEKIEGVLNSTIAAYSQRTGEHNYKMPRISEKEWERIYSNISMITFFQGRKIGLTNYNGYCVLNSTNHNEYPNPNLLYFIDIEGNYHDIRCNHKDFISTGYPIGDFNRRKVPETMEITNEDGSVDVVETGKYLYRFKNDEINNALACYYCINGQDRKTEDNKPVTVYDYINDSDTGDATKRAYYTALAKARLNTVKLTQTD